MTALLLAMAPRVANVTDNIVAVSIKIRTQMPKATAVPAIARMRSIHPR